MADRTNTDPARMEKIVSLCKRRGFIFQSAEIYGGLNGCWDYGPMGVELKRNLKEYWWRKNVQEREDVVGMDSSILTHNSVLVASGHVGGFSDPMCDCLLTKERLRADQVPAQSGMGFFYTGAAKKDGSWNIEKKYSVLVESEKQADKARKTAAQYYAQLAGKDASYKDMELKGECMETVTDSTMYNPANGSLLTEAREFNLMFKTTIGATSDENDPNATAGCARKRPSPFSASIKTFWTVPASNCLSESPRSANLSATKSTRGTSLSVPANSNKWKSNISAGRKTGCVWWMNGWNTVFASMTKWGFRANTFTFWMCPDGERAFYSKKTYDLEYEFPFGIQELEGIAYRTDYDLSCHQKGSGRPLEYFDEETREKFIPHVVEPSAGCDRTILAIICEAYDEEELVDDKGKKDVRTVLRFVPRMAPIKAAIFPLLKKNGEQVRIAREIEKTLQPWMSVFYDETGAVGRRYRRQDEVGTPFCITVDFETLGENDASLKGTVTIRHRDSMKQERVAINDLLHWLIARVR